MWYLFSKITERHVGRCLTVAVLLCICGCGDFFAHKPTELQTKMILKDLKQIEENPNVKNPLPELYRQPPQKLEVDDGVKVFYFCKQHSASKLAELIYLQFSHFFKPAVPPQGKPPAAPTYSAIGLTPHDATNQLIIHCPNDAQTDKILQFLEKVDVPPIQVNIDCLVLERFADVTMDWETTIKIDNLLGEKVTFGGKMDGAGNLLPAFPGASLREPKRSTFGLDIGYWKNQGIAGHEFRAVVDLLISRGYLTILMNPTIETVNGKKGKITLRDYVPLEKILSQAGFDEPFNLTEYQWVEDVLEVTPSVFADGSIGLATKVQLGSKSKPEGVVQTSIITERTIEVMENRISPGDSLVIGGIRKIEERGVVRGVPLLKDIPIIGILFSSKDLEEKATEVIFILTPSISSGGVEYTEMLEKVRQKRATPDSKTGFHEALTDPFGDAAYTRGIEKQAAAAEFERFKAEIQKAEALEEMDQIKQQLLKTAEEVLAEKAKAAQARQEAVKAKKEAEKAKVETEKAKGEMEQSKAGADKARQEAEKAKQEAEEAKAEIEKAKSETEKSKEEAEAAKKASDDANAQAEQAKAENEKLRDLLDQTEPKTAPPAATTAKDEPEGEKGTAKTEENESASQQSEASKA
jgi:Flp pilus assembly secretin CpaC